LLKKFGFVTSSEGGWTARGDAANVHVPTRGHFAALFGPVATSTKWPLRPVRAPISSPLAILLYHPTSFLPIWFTFGDRIFCSFLDFSIEIQTANTSRVDYQGAALQISVVRAHIPKMAALPHNNAFGAHSPSWNLPFPDGNLTAAEVIAYLPHWLKSIDVVDRFLSHGGRSANLAAMINVYRDLPTGSEFKPNSVMIMMSYAMRRAGYENWSVGSHFDYPRQIARPETDLNVKDFRTPRMTHPKDVRTVTPSKVAANMEAEPLHFKDLAIHVKQHPTGPEALDLARCVQYALQHQDEEWFFPTDFRRLTFHLGGPAPVTHAHLDRQIFARHNNYQFSPSKSTPGKNRRPIKRGTPKNVTPSRCSKMKTRVTDIMEQALSGKATPQKRLAESLGSVELGSKRRSGRLVGKKTNFGEDSEIDGSVSSSPHTACSPSELASSPPDEF
jgi:hypothetical protein